MIRYVCLFFIFFIVSANGLSDRKSSLTFVIDVTSSMETVISEVKSQAADILDALTNSNESYIDHFVLATFADTDRIATSVTNVTQTKDKSEFKVSLDQLTRTLLPGGDCPEYSMSGIQAGMEHSTPGSTIYVFTDASAKDNETYDYVKYIALKKEIQIIFILTKGCNPKLHQYGYKVYRNLAADTFGQVFNLNKHEVTKILKYIKNSAVARRIVLAVKLFKSGDSNTFYYTTDHATKDTMISVSCTKPKVNVTGSDSGTLDIIPLVNLTHVMVLQVNEPNPGAYAVTIDCKSDSRTLVTAKSSIHFQHGFSTFQPTSLNDTTSQPVPDYSSYLAIKIDGEFEPKTVELLDVSDNTISNSTMTLKVLDTEKKFYATELFDIETPVFRILLTGIDLKYNTTIVRVGSLLQQQNVSLTESFENKEPLVSVDGYPRIIVDYDSPVRLKCSVHAYPKPEITWQKDGTNLNGTNVYFYELPYDFVSLYEIEKVNQNATYTCKATNSMGNNTEVVTVAAKTKMFFDVVASPRDITIQYNETDKIRCVVNSYPPADITWSKAGKVLVTKDELIISDDGFEMTILNMQPVYEGKYECEVSNGIKNITFPFNVNISGVVKPKIKKPSKTLITITENSDTNISCRIEEGTPHPDLKWYHKNTIFGIFAEITKPENQENFILPKINRKDSGIYRCFIENIGGSDTMEVAVVVEYKPILCDSDVKSVTKKVGQEVILTCKSDGIPDPNITWTKDDKHLLGSKFVSSSDHRIIFDADLYDMGTYRCNVSNYLGSVSKSIYVEVESPPKVVINASDPVDVPYNESITLACEVFGYPRPDIIWKDISNTEIDVEIEEKTRYHFFNNITIEHVTTANTYECIANTTDLIDKKTVTVQPSIHFDPINIPKDTTYHIEYNSTHKILCIVDSMPLAEVNWYKSGTLIAKDHPSVTPNGTELTLKHMESIDTGNYKCEIIYMNHTYTYPFNIQITGLENPKISQFLNTSYVPENSHINISCRIEKGIPKPVIQWFKKDMLSSTFTNITGINSEDDENLILNSINRNETGTYKCVATNEVGYSSMETNVVVQYPPSIDSETIPMVVQAGEKAKLKCISDGVPKPVVAWTKDQKHLNDSKFIKSIDDGLTFTVDLFDTGEYTCNASNIMGYSNKTMPLKVEQLPNVTISQNDSVEAEYDEPLTLTCEVFGFPKPDIIWTDSFKTELKTELNEKSPFHFISYLHIENVTKNDTYRCQANNTLGDDDREITVLTFRKSYYNVLKYPKDKIYDIEYGKTHIFSCIIDAYPPVVVNWYKNEKIVTKDDLSVSSDGSGLTIKGMQLVDAGYFKCEAAHLDITYTYPFEVHITGVEKPKISDYRNISHISENSDVEIICRIEKGIPKPSIQWLYKNTATSPYIEITENKDNEHLSLKNIKRNNSGTYKCIATNDMGTDMMVTELLVEYAPYIDNDFLPVTVETKESIVLKCLAYGIPKPTVLWTKDDKPLTDSKVLKSSNLNFAAKLTDAGEYTCIATNILGSANKTLILKVEMRPHVIINESNPVNAEIDEPLTLACEVFGYPKPYIVWKDVIWKTELKYEIEEKTPFNFISYLKINKARNLTYECIASNDLGNDYDFINVTAVKKPYFKPLRTPRDTNIAYNSKKVIHCEIDAYPPAAITWFKDSNLLTKRDNVKVSADGGTLTFDNMQPSQQGTYICEANNGVDKKRFMAYVSIFGLEAPEIFKTLSEKKYSIRIYRFVEGSSNYLDCKIHRGIPKPTLTWFYEDKITKSYTKIIEANNQEYFFLNKVHRNSGNYKCEANQYDDQNNYMGSDSLNMELEIGYPPTIRPDKRTYAVKTKHNVSVPCSVEGYPTPEVIWTRQGKSSTLKKNPDHTLRLQMMMKYNGTYICNATNEYGTAIRSVVIYVYTLDIKNKRVNNSKKIVEEGESLELICDVKGIPKPYVAWFYNGTVTDPKVPGLLVGSGQKFEIESILYIQRGRYTCVALNYGCETLLFEIHVSATVKIHNTNHRIRAVAGDLALTIHCNATGNPILFEWTLNGIRDSERGDTKVFKKVTSTIASSSVICLAKGEDKDNFDTFSFTIIVDDYPSLNNLNYTQTEIAGARVQVHCPIYHKRGDLLRWYRDNTKIHDKELIFNSIRTSDAGLYTCRVSNYTSSVSANVNLTVTSRLTFINYVETNISLKFEERASLDCLATGDALPKVSWSYKGSVISTNPIYKLKMKYEKEGSYKCEATDGTDTISRTFHVSSDECILNIDPNGRQPLILTTYSQWPTYNYSGGFLYMPRNQSVILACPRMGHMMYFADDQDYLHAYCNKSKLEIMKTPYTFSDLSCSEEVRPQEELIHKPCFGVHTETIKIFYEFRSKKIEVYEVCLYNGESSFYVPIFTKHKLKSPLAESVPKHVTWFKDERRPIVDFDDLYDADNQINEISSTLGFWWHKTDHCVFYKRQLVNSQDVFPGVPQKAIFTHLNVVPHWSTCNNENWDEVESRVRGLAKTNELTVWTGTAGNLRLPDLDGVPQAIFLTTSDRHSMLVSTYIWKVVQDASKGASLAIVQLNIPDVTAPYSYVKCEDICNRTLWMKGNNWHNVAKGYTFCCKLKDFEASFGYYGVFGTHMDTILNK